MIWVKIIEAEKCKQPTKHTYNICSAGTLDLLTELCMAFVFIIFLTILYFLSLPREHKFLSFGGKLANKVSEGF